MGSKKEKDLLDLFYRDRVKITWKNLGEHALGMYETPLDALDILAKYSSLLRKAAPGTYALCDLIETERKKSGKKVNKIIDENLEKFCILLRVNYKNVAPSLSEMQKNPKLKTAAKGKLDRQLVINRIVERHRRLVKKNKSEFKNYQKKDKKTKALNKLLLSKVSKK